MIQHVQIKVSNRFGENKILQSDAPKMVEVRDKLSKKKE